MRKTYTRINVVGTSGSGKTFLSRVIAHRLNFIHIEMDELYWNKDWQPTPDDVFVRNIQKLLRDDEWVLDGNYSVTDDVKFARAQLVVWIDLPWYQTVFRVITRTVRRVVKNEVLWNANKESFRTSFLSKDSIILWTLKSNFLKRNKYVQTLDDPRYSDIKFIRLRSSREIAAFVDELI